MFGWLEDITIHCGTPEIPTKLDVRKGVRAAGKNESFLHYQHPVKRWYGISYRSVWFLGFMKFDKRKDEYLFEGEEPIGGFKK